MKRFHIHVGVKNIGKSVQFYSTLFGQKPTKLKEDYAKWMLDDPRVNFAISTRSDTEGVDHMGIQVDEGTELKVIADRLKNADLGVYGEGESTCCYAESEKAWVTDPSGIAWEAYHSMAQAEIFGGPKAVESKEVESCCDSKRGCC